MKNNLSRRTFIGHAAGGIASLAAAPALAADEKPAEIAAGLNAAKPAELWLALIKQLDPERLGDEHLAALRADVQWNLRRSALLSGLAMTNADEPAPVFRAWRAEG